MTTAPQSTATSQPLASRDRILSLDQFRGYTVVGMLLVNFLGSFSVAPAILKHHHDYCSYADTIMPQFLFAVGFAFRLTYGRRMQQAGTCAGQIRMLRRLLGLVLVSLVVYNVSPPAASWSELVEMGPAGILPDLLKRNWFQTLMHIAVTSLWLLPVIGSSGKIRLLWMVGSGAAHILLSWWFNYEWTNSSPNAIDGGPLGFLSWAVPALTGTFACDWVVSAAVKRPLLRLTVLSLALAGLGYLMSCGTRLYDVSANPDVVATNSKLAKYPVVPSQEQLDHWLRIENLRDRLAEPPFVQPPGQELRKWNYWMMSQRAATLSYTTFCAGVSGLVFVLFSLASDVLRWQSAVFQTFGTNALVAYVLHEMVSAAVKPFIPRDSPGWYVAAGLTVFFLLTWTFVRSLQKQSIFLRL